MLQCLQWLLHWKLSRPQTKLQHYCGLRSEKRLLLPNSPRCKTESLSQHKDLEPEPEEASSSAHPPLQEAPTSSKQPVKQEQIPIPKNLPSSVLEVKEATEADYGEVTPPAAFFTPMPDPATGSTSCAKFQLLYRDSLVLPLLPGSLSLSLRKWSKRTAFALALLSFAAWSRRRIETSCIAVLPKRIADVLVAREDVDQVVLIDDLLVVVLAAVVLWVPYWEVVAFIAVVLPLLVDGVAGVVLLKEVAFLALDGNSVKPPKIS